MRLGTFVATVGFLAVGAGIVAWAMGAFDEGRVRPGTAPEPAGLAPPAATVTVERGAVTLVEEAVGTVRARDTVGIAAQVVARILELRPRVGQAVAAGDVVVVLDAREFQARLDQAKKALVAAEAAGRRAEQARSQAQVRRVQASNRWERQKNLLAKSVTSPEQAEAAETDFLLAEAGVADAAAAIAAAEALREQAQQVVKEAEVALGYTTIHAPFAGVVVERAAEPGDLAAPGRVLLVVLDPTKPRLEAAVREGLIGRLRRGESYEVVLPTAGVTVRGTVAEIVPSADPKTRTFAVRVDFDPVEGVYVGMFGRLRIPTGTREEVHVPAAAVVRVGQLETVLLRQGERYTRRLVTTGAVGEDGKVEVLSGLVGGEVVGVPGDGP